MTSPAFNDVQPPQSLEPAQQPEPGDAQQQEQIPEPSAEQESPAARKEWTPDDAQREIEKLRKENASWRTKYREAEPIVKAHNKRVESEKTELQRAQERITQYESDLATAQQQTQLLGFAAKYGIPEEDYDLLGAGTSEEMESRAVRLAHMREAALGNQQAPAPPTNRPLESLRPGASPPPPLADNSYPEAWRPRGLGPS